MLIYFVILSIFAVFTIDLYAATSLMKQIKSTGLRGSPSLIALICPVQKLRKLSLIFKLKWP